MKLNIVSPNGILFEGEAANISFPGLEARSTYCPITPPIIAALNAGTIQFETNGEMQKQPIQGGFVEVKDDIVSVCVE